MEQFFFFFLPSLSRPDQLDSSKRFVILTIGYKTRRYPILVPDHFGSILSSGHVFFRPDIVACYFRVLLSPTNFFNFFFFW